MFYTVTLKASTVELNRLTDRDLERNPACVHAKAPSTARTRAKYRCEKKQTRCRIIKHHFVSALSSWPGNPCFSTQRY
ncbi:uncharacterized protein MYCGRDRAFT_105810 [Zymoseptoria tritici IPO323]|uniref:Uncharacterized protein n=1 Tax=Zymoseptoria tritici (strain CBS 115943 / IPO323) TaxID=336722 RepID=F9XKG7_ZYMTI|nr:uncharacterized protein MYCGRDRAFT_105810 [Zymoseptoria tritici IPO323]EGP84539.1 hypothetical protein MYCGRDRAFT_105810 [Zymoseptoria tritici IPO323]